ncbi:MAG TPA: replication-associated recombination protein A [bacterium]|nr:replication-associated recombination protein A [bacterium]
MLSPVPLAARIRPQTLAEFVGQEHLVGEGKVLWGLVQSGRLHSLVLWGPPGTGKTTLIRLLASETGTRLVEFSAVTSGIAEVRKVIAEAQARLQEDGSRTAVFIDELHRFNKAQQDAFLPHVENGTIILLGATTENPYFSINAALLSRLKVYQLKALTDDDLAVILDRALAALAGEGTPVEATPEARALLIELAGGDARFVIGALEVAATILGGQPEAPRTIDVPLVEQVLQQRALLYDKTGDQHYDIISAFIKSIRGSDVDAVLYYLARMLEAGEDPAFIARRLVISATEDVGLANPMGIVVANACREAVEFIGLPEAHYPLAHAAVYLAASPKSNSAGAALHAARKAVKQGPNPPVPLHLRNAPVPRMAREHGMGVGYRFPHDSPSGWVPQDYLPEGVSGAPYYKPKTIGEERDIAEYLRRLKAPRG